MCTRNCEECEEQGCDKREQLIAEEELRNEVESSLDNYDVGDNDDDDDFSDIEDSISVGEKLSNAIDNNYCQEDIDALVVKYLPVLRGKGEYFEECIEAASPKVLLENFDSLGIEIDDVAKRMGGSEVIDNLECLLRYGVSHEVLSSSIDKEWSASDILDNLDLLREYGFEKILLAEMFSRKSFDWYGARRDDAIMLLSIDDGTAVAAIDMAYGVEDDISDEMQSVFKKLIRTHSITKGALLKWLQAHNLETNEKVTFLFSET